METADDAGLALLLKRRGANIELLSGNELIEVDWYPTIGGMFDGVVQRMLLGAHYSLFLFALQCLLMTLSLLAPVLLALMLLSSPALLPPVLGLYLMPSVLLGFGLRRFPIPIRQLWLWPVGALMLGYGMWRALITVCYRDGLYWRGSVYPLDQLRNGQRVRPASFFAKH